MTFRAVILDFDGLILDTESPILDSWQREYRDHGCELGMEHWQHALGTMGGFDPFGHLLTLTGKTLDREETVKRVNERNWAECERLDLLPGVKDRLHEARALGLGTAVASSSTAEWVERWLGRHAIRHLFDVRCTREDVARVKPAPDLFLLAAERLGVPPETCVVFEDSPNGIRAAKAAGMRSVAVPNALTTQLVLPEPDLVVASLAERKLAEILAVFAV
jgi:HAD superfamily hydrolase (TIGR01509 family)